MIQKDSIQEVIQTAQVEEVIGDHVQLKRSGRNLKGLCPFHNEKTPSFMVSPEKGIYKCFGCGASGDSVRFLMDLDGLSFPEAIRSLAQKYGIKLVESNDPEDQRVFEHRDSLYIRNEKANDFFESQLWESEYGKAVGLSYFKERGFLESTIKKYRLGMTSPGKDGLKKYMQDSGFAPEEVDEVGLLNQYGGDFFRERVIFPIQNASGKILGFAGRILSSDKKAPKYVNTRETEIYNKRNILYGLFQARQEIKKLDKCLLVEGYTDVMSLHQYGVRNVVAASGTSLTPEQCQLLRRYTQKIMLLFDGDAAGINAALRGLDVMLGEDLFPEIVMLPDGEDPDSFMRDVGTSGFEEYINENAKDFILFKSDWLIRSSKTNPIERAKAYKDVAKSLAYISDPITRRVYVQECAQMFQIEEGIILSEVNKIAQKNNQKNLLKEQRNQEKRQTIGPTKVDTTSPKSDDRYQERGIVRTMLLYGDQTRGDGVQMSQYLKANFAEELNTFDDDLSRQILQEHFEGLENGEYRDLSYFVAHQNTEISRLCIDLITSPHSYSPNWENIMDNTLLNQPPPEKNYEAESHEQILRVKMRKINKMIHEVQNLLTKGNLAREEEEFQLNVLLRYAETRNAIAKQIGQIIVT